MSSSAEFGFLHYNATGASNHDILPPIFGDERIEGLNVYQRFLFENSADETGNMLAFSPIEQMRIEEAKSFVEGVTGLAVTCAFEKYDSLPEEGILGLYNPHYHKIKVEQVESSGAYGDEIAFISVLVHEIMHSTGNATRQIIGIQEGSAYRISHIEPHQTSEVTSSQECESFFEEGLAEEIASRWRVQFDPNLQGRERQILGVQNKDGLPVRMYRSSRPIDEMTTGDWVHTSQPATCAFGIQLLSEYTGVDLIDLLLQARTPETRNYAVQAIKETVDSVELGLYDILIAAEYQTTDFDDGLALIEAAIANNAIERHRQEPLNEN